MVLILSGGGTDLSLGLTKEFLKRVQGKKLIGVIANAREEKDYDSTLKWINAKLLPPNHNCVLKLVNQNSNLKDFDGIIIGGGNTFKLLRDIKIFKMEGELVKYSISKPIYGISAGAIIMGSSISTAYTTDENTVKLKDLKGLNIIENTGFECHYVDSSLDLVRTRLNEFDKIICLPEGSGIIYEPKTKGLIELGKVIILN